MTLFNFLCMGISVRAPRIELGTDSWQEPILPLNYARDKKCKVSSAKCKVKHKITVIESIAYILIFQKNNLANDREYNLCSCF